MASEKKGFVDGLEDQILRIVDESTSSVTFGHLANRVGGSMSCGRKEIKQALSNLISSGALCYTSHFGRSLIERSLEAPFQISTRVIVKPAICTYDQPFDGVVVSIEKGASFGNGAHPTTRMCIDLIDHSLLQAHWRKTKDQLKAIDIGTGSGILSIVVARLGVGSVIGLDRDPCSIFEARRNVSINDLCDRITICEDSLDDLNFRFDLVVANLRSPTLINLCDELINKLNDTCVMVFSGMKSEESFSVCAPYQKKGFRIIGERWEKGWAAVCMVRG